MINSNIIREITIIALIMVGSMACFACSYLLLPNVLLYLQQLIKSIIFYFRNNISSYRNVDLPPSVKRAIGLDEDFSNLPPWLDRWSRVATPKLKNAGLGNVNVLHYIMFVVLTGSAGFLIGVVWLHNLTFALALGAASYIIPDQLILARSQRLQRKYVEQLTASIRILHAKLQEQSHIQAAFTNTARETNPPLGNILQDAAMNLSAGHDPVQVFAKLQGKFRFDYGRMFVQLMLAAWYDVSVQPAFISLAAKMYSQRTLDIENQKKLFSQRFSGIILNALCVPVYFYISHYRWGYEYFHYTFLGRLTVTMWLVSVILGIVLERMFSFVD